MWYNISRKENILCEEVHKMNRTLKIVLGIIFILTLPFSLEFLLLVAAGAALMIFVSS